MIEPYSATAIITAFLIIWAIIIPILGTIPKVREIISYRYLTVTVFLACMIGVIINFSGLETSVRMAVIVGTAILSGLYLLIRSFEKAAYNGWIDRKIEAKVSKGDISAQVTLEKQDRESHGTDDA